MYKVLESFNDPEHRRVYHKGDTYPAPSHVAVPERIAYLSGCANRFGKPLLEPEQPEPEQPEPEQPESEEQPEPEEQPEEPKPAKKPGSTSKKS